MINDDLAILAKSIATDAHRGQKDKGGADYITHPVRVANGCVTNEEKIVALLHDVLEDTDINEEYLIKMGFPGFIVDAIKSVTRKSGEHYEDFIERCSLDPIGIKVKLEDLRDNMDVSRLKNLNEKDFERLKKYHKAYWYLKSKL